MLYKQFRLFIDKKKGTCYTVSGLLKTNRNVVLKMMKIGIGTDTMRGAYPDEMEAVRQYAAMGFEALDYSYYNHCKPDDVYLSEKWEDYARQLKQAADEAGIIFSQVHAPYGRCHTKEQEALMEESTRRAFRVTELLGAPYLVVHPEMFPDCINGENAERDLAYNVEKYRRMIPLAEKHHVVIALENMFSWDPAVHRVCRTTFSTMEEILECLHRLNDEEHFAVCLDTGHCHLLRESPAIAAKKLGKHLKLLHVHDNWGIQDDHMAPYYGNINWDAFLDALEEIGYTGEFSSEASSMGELLPPKASATGAKLVYEITDAMLRKRGLRK